MATKAKFKIFNGTNWVEYDFGGTVDFSNYVSKSDGGTVKGNLTTQGQLIVDNTNGISFSNTTEPKFNSNKYQATYTFPEQGGTIALTKDIPSVVNNLTSTSTSSALSAAQGKALNDKFAKYALTSEVTNVYQDLENYYYTSAQSDEKFINKNDEYISLPGLLVADRLSANGINLTDGEIIFDVDTVLQLPNENGTLATRGWVSTQNYFPKSGGTIDGELNVNDYLWAEELYAGGNDDVVLGSNGIYTSKNIESGDTIKVSGTQMDDTGFHTSEDVDAGWINAKHEITLGTNKEVSMQYDSGRKALKFVF